MNSKRNVGLLVTLFTVTSLFTAGYSSEAMAGESEAVPVSADVNIDKYASRFMDMKETTQKIIEEQQRIAEENGLQKKRGLRKRNGLQKRNGLRKRKRPRKKRPRRKRPRRRPPSNRPPRPYRLRQCRPASQIRTFWPRLYIVKPETSRMKDRLQ